MTKNKINLGPWTGGEVRRLLAHVAKDRDAAYIAKRLHRSVGAVRSKVYRLKA